MLFVELLISYLVYLSGPIKYFGDRISIDEYKKLEVCESKVCLKDANKFVSYLSRDNESDPCEDFNDYACGNFFETYNENNSFYGPSLKNNFIVQYYQKMRKVLEQKINDDEPKIFKLTKTYYNHCMSPGEFFNHHYLTLKINLILFFLH